MDPKIHRHPRPRRRPHHSRHGRHPSSPPLRTTRRQNRPKTILGQRPHRNRGRTLPPRLSRQGPRTTRQRRYRHRRRTQIPTGNHPLHPLRTTTPKTRRHVHPPSRTRRIHPRPGPSTLLREIFANIPRRSGNGTPRTRSGRTHRPRRSRRRIARRIGQGMGSFRWQCSFLGPLGGCIDSSLVLDVVVDVFRLVSSIQNRNDPVRDRRLWDGTRRTRQGNV
mmetsp:Transcript_20390/g.42928  ORF Transcript_20390/g.42928 Transcript_20390/m.42928 type:complete len:221 (+) Transcript_20390:317-979(+)